MSDDFFEVAVMSRAGDSSAELVGEFVEPAVVDADSDWMDAQIPDEFVVCVDGTGDDEHALMRHIFLIFHDGRVDAIGAFSDDASRRKIGAIADFVGIFEQDDSLSFVDDFSLHVLSEVLSELLVQSQSPLIAVDGDEDLRVGEFDEQFELALTSVPRAMKSEVGTIDEARTLSIKPIDDGVDASFVAGDLSRRVDERIGGAEFDDRVFALRNTEERCRFFALRTGDDEDEVVGFFVDIFFAEDFEVLRHFDIAEFASRCEVCE